MKICLIGSTRFIDKFNEWNTKLTLMGHVVYSVAMAGVSQGEEKVKKGPTVSDDEKETLDLIHLMKIANSDSVCLITDDTGYFGASTRKEIKWCLLTGKNVLLPEHYKGLGENMEGLTKGIQEAIRDLKNEKFISKIHGGNIKI